MLQLILTSKDGTSDIASMVGQISWSGDYQLCTRILEFDLVSDYQDKNVPAVLCELGNSIILKNDGKVLFDGFVFTRQKTTEASLISVTCYDRGIYLKRNKASYYANNTTPAALTRQICSDFGIKTGSIADPPVKIRRKFLGYTLYEMIQTMYTLASVETGKKYMVLFQEDAMWVVEKQPDPDTLIIDGQTNLMRASTSESIENMINQVAIYSKNDTLIKTVKNDNAIRLYGVMQDYLKQYEEDMTKKAQKLLSDNDVEQKITIENLGNTGCLTGRTVIVREPYTGLYGLFFIDSDIHTWKLGQYYNKLTVNFREIMDEKEVGQLVK